MFDSKSKDPNELDLGEINLLPEDMRSAAEKYKRSAKEEAAYQLRAPKKVKKRRRVFAWLPFFGGSHWEVTGPVTPKSQAPVPKLSDAVAVDTARQDGQQGGTSTSNEFGIIKPVFGEVKAAPISPKTKRSFKGGISLRSLFGKKHPVIASRGTINGNNGTQQQVPSFTTPPRHYSLLSDDAKKASASSVHPVAQPPLPTQTFDEPVAHGIRPITPQASGLPAQSSSASRVRTWHLPKWLDIFALLKFFSRPRSPKPVKPVAPKQAPVQSPQPIATSKNYAPTQPHSLLRPIEAVASAPTAPVQTPIQQRGPITPVATTTTSPSRPSVLAPRIETPMPHAPKPPKQKREWHLPKWLDIFYLLSLLRSRKKAVKPIPPPSPKPAVPQSKPIVASSVPPQPVTPIPSRTQPEQSIPAVKPVTMPQTPAQPVAIPSAPMTPQTAPAARPLGAPPAPQTPVVSNDIVPIADAHTPAAEKKHKMHGGGLFHIPTKSSFASVSKELRDINLIPGSFTAARSWKQIGQLMGITVLAACGVVGLIYGGLHLFRGQLEKRTAEIDAEINAFKDDILVYNKQEPEMSSLGARVDLVAKLLEQHIYWTNFFGLLEKYTLADIYYDGVSATTNGNLSLSAHGSSFETVSQQLQLLSSEQAKEFVSSASISGAQLSQGADGTEQVSFSIELTLNPKLFYYAGPK